MQYHTGTNSTRHLLATCDPDLFHNHVNFNVWSFDLIFLAPLATVMDCCIWTKFSVNSSSRFPVRARTHGHTNRQRPPYGHSATAGMKTSWQRSVVKRIWVEESWGWSVGPTSSRSGPMTLLASMLGPGSLDDTWLCCTPSLPLLHSSTPPSAAAANTYTSHYQSDIN